MFIVIKIYMEILKSLRAKVKAKEKRPTIYLQGIYTVAQLKFDFWFTSFVLLSLRVVGRNQNNNNNNIKLISYNRDLATFIVVVVVVAVGQLPLLLLSISPDYTRSIVAIIVIVILYSLCVIIY